MMSSSEYQSYYDCGLMPERFWPEEVEKLRVRYLADEIDLSYFEKELEGLFDIRGLEEIWYD